MKTRRWLAGIIDVLLVKVIIYIAWSHIDYPHTPYFGFYFALISFVIFLILTSVSIIITGGTAGDRVMSIRCEHESNTALPMLLLRNLLLGLFIFLPYMEGNGSGELVFLILAIVVLLPLTSRHDKALVQSWLDRLLKTRYIKYSYSRGEEKIINPV